MLFLAIAWNQVFQGQPCVVRKISAQNHDTCKPFRKRNNMRCTLYFIERHHFYLTTPNLGILAPQIPNRTKCSFDHRLELVILQPDENS